MSIDEDNMYDNEINILKSVQHRNIVKIIESFKWRDNLCIVLEFCLGGDLRSLTK